MGQLWDRKYQDLLKQFDREKNIEADRHARLIEKLRALEAEATALRKLSGASRDRMKVDLERLIAIRDDPTVVVRDYQRSTVRVYHADWSCGWVGPHGYREFLLTEATARALKPCTSCGYRISKAGHASKAA